MSKIEWTGKTWNPLVGCTIHSAGCKGCFAMRDAYRLMHNPNPAIAEKFEGVAKMVNGHAVWTGRINFSEAALKIPLRRHVATTWFVNSMSDLFHQHVPDEQIDRIFAVMALCPQHTFQVLTKRADRMRAYLNNPSWPRRVSEIVNAWPASEIGHGNEFTADFALCFGAQLPNVWLGVSVEDQQTADERIPDLLATPAAVRFLSCEPLIGPVDLRSICNGHYFQNPLTGDRWHETPEGLGGASDQNGARIHWVICGGESGPNARPMHPHWARSLRDQCAAAGVAFFFKQWGEWRPQLALETHSFDTAKGRAQRTPAFLLNRDGSVHCFVGSAETNAPVMLRVGKREAGRLLDGGEHNGMPV